MAKSPSLGDSTNAEHCPDDVDPTSESALSRRNFLTRAGQAGWAAFVLGPVLRHGAFPLPVHAPPTVPEANPLGASAAGDLTSLYSGLRWRMLGPFRGGRVDAVTGVPGRPHEFYMGAVNGGVWKTIDGGRVWEPIFDSQHMSSIGAIAVAPSAPDVVYVGSGECTLRDSVGFGNGVYKSTDAGKTWTHLGLEDTQHIRRVAVHPHDPNTVFVAAIGHFYGPNPERGVFRSKDGGKTWKKVLFKNENVGASEVVIDPTNPKVVYAALWNTRRPPWFVYAPTNGPGGGLFKSTDGGDTWKELTNGLPKSGIGKVGIAVCPSNPKRVYAVIDDLEPDPNAPRDTSSAAGQYGEGANGQGGFFRSDDAGESWKRISSDPALWGRGWYFEHIGVDPHDADVVYVPNVAVSRTRDGGKTWDVIRGSPGGDDYQGVWVSPDDPNTLILASDQGTIITHNAKTDDPKQITWTSWYNQPTAQMYHISVDYRFPYWVTGAQQDSGAVAVCSRGKFAEISERDWEPSGAGGESGYTAGDPLHPGIIYGGTGTRYDLAHNLRIPGTTTPEVPKGEKARKDWTQPLVLSKADPRALYFGYQYLFLSTDSAKTWTRISPDLTRPNPGVPKLMDAAAAADLDPANGQRGVIYTIAPSPLLVPMVWVGTDDGVIQVTTNNGKTWENVTPKEVTAWSRVTMMEASHFDFDTAYASVDRHQLEDFDPYIYRTRDRGKTWQKITQGLPAGAYVHSVKEDPARQGLLVAGTERGAYVSFNDGDSWQPLQLNLPTTSVRDFEFYGTDLIVATHGRGIWVIDDISPLRQATDEILTADAYLFKPADAMNYVQGGDNGTPVQKDEPHAENPPDGAAIDYYLKSAAGGTVTLEISDDKGKVLHTFSSEEPEFAAGSGGGGRRRGGIPNVSPLWQPAPPSPLSTEAGMHRVMWLPVADSPRGGRGGGGGGGFRRRGPLLTGDFTAKLTVNGKSYTQTFTVKPDPRGGEMAED
ncbi:MAG TPA: glycosyl hydrolase [Gemmatimonadaceae bacterium]|nr:glycosyl hydrolase [Gemmatimonadaceae bacterium]